MRISSQTHQKGNKKKEAQIASSIKNAGKKKKSN
jgi:hypothetical protein